MAAHSSLDSSLSGAAVPPRAVQWLRSVVETMGALVSAVGLVVAVVGLARRRTLIAGMRQVRANIDTPDPAGPTAMVSQ
jgi:hypothetical protein